MPPGYGPNLRPRPGNPVQAARACGTGYTRMTVSELRKPLHHDRGSFLKGGAAPHANPEVPKCGGDLKGELGDPGSFKHR
ncbi:hypothetical protein GCM10007890_55520 [Methylobacterium tardum]|uniref:Uncharacterized protein n=1 Tax=Methylobacterium tardum TaxID=374432 RepID=A0AA37TK57_9HYPH|nr:hypothetical protein GCM10007890_55520 [Methylobacterium tardum]